MAEALTFHTFSFWFLRRDFRFLFGHRGLFHSLHARFITVMVSRIFVHATNMATMQIGSWEWAPVCSINLWKKHSISLQHCIFLLLFLVLCRWRYNENVHVLFKNETFLRNKSTLMNKIWCSLRYSSLHGSWMTYNQ